MTITRLIGPILGLAAGFGLAACGGSSSSNMPPGNNPPPAGPTAITAIGSITGFGSVWVNGARYEVESGTVIAIEDELETLGDDSALRLGMKVRVTGTDTNGRRSADRIEYDEDLKGPIESITPDGGDPATGTISVVSTTVTIDVDTVFDDDVGDNDGVPGIDFRDLQVGMVVEVSGFPTGEGFLATRIDRETDGVGGNPDMGDPAVDGDELELKGFVESIASDNGSIRVGGVDFIINSGTMFEDGLMLSNVPIGAFVEVKADFVDGELIAVRVEREDDFDADDHEGQFEIEGVLQAVDTVSSPNTFTIDGITMPIIDASPLASLVGMRVEIEGSFNDDGVLVLREAEQDAEDNVRTEDLIEIVEADSFTTRLGLVISPDGNSGVQDDAGENGDHLTPAEFLSRLAARDRIEARGFQNADGSVTWTRVERDELAAENDDLECELRGPIQLIDGDDATDFSFVIQGVTVITTNVAENNFEGANDQPIGRAAFFGAIDIGVVVEAESFEGDAFCMPGMLEAREVSLEPADGS